MSDAAHRAPEDLTVPTAWTPYAPGQTELQITPVVSAWGPTLRLEFDFHDGGGFVIARRACPLVLPENFSFTFALRGDAPRNHFEFKLVDASGHNVWRFREADFAVPATWQHMTLTDEDIPFGWGPLGGGPPRDVASIEFAIAAGPGGRGTLELAALTLQDDTYRLTPQISASSTRAGYLPGNVLADTATTGWHSAELAGQWLAIDFGMVRGMGALAIDWADTSHGDEAWIQTSPDGAVWVTVGTLKTGHGARRHVLLNTRTRHLRVVCPAATATGFGIRHVEIKPNRWGKSLNDFFAALGAEAPRGHYPRYLQGEQSYWTVIGTPTGGAHALFNEEGMVEISRGGPTLEAFVHCADHLHTWADATIGQALVDSWIPLPSSTWACPDFSLTIRASALAETPAGLQIHYRLENTTSTARTMILFVAIRPFQVTPHWQAWKNFGGVANLHTLEAREDGVWIDGHICLSSPRKPFRFGALTFADGPVTAALSAGQLPSAQRVDDPFGAATGVLAFTVSLAPAAHQDIVLSVTPGAPPDRADPTVPVLQSFVKAAEQWQTQLTGWDIQLPEGAQDLVHDIKTAAAHILINRDGPALQPGPRRYTRAWIRDGVIMGCALLRLGLKTPLRDFVRWYALAQRDDGMLPDCRDSEGAEWLPEFDAFGELVYAIAEYFRFSADKAFVRELWPAVTAALNCMAQLRATRLTPEYETPARRRYYGLLPESMSHEGYMGHPAHAYWDDFWGLRGLKDGIALAATLDDVPAYAQYTQLLADFRRDVYASIARCARELTLDFIPGSADQADLDPTATAIALAPVDELAHLPRNLLEHTFDLYLTTLRRRHADQHWHNYTAYEIRIAGALLRLGRRSDALEVLASMQADQRPRAWHQWPEISWRDPLSPSFLGDLPHTWIAAEYILVVTALFAFEREADEALVIGAGIAAAWLRDGFVVEVKALPTHYGPLSYTLRQVHAGALRLQIPAGITMPRGGIIIQPPLDRPLRQVTVNEVPIESFGPDSVTCLHCPADIVMTY